MVSVMITELLELMQLKYWQRKGRLVTAKVVKFLICTYESNFKSLLNIPVNFFFVVNDFIKSMRDDYQSKMKLLVMQCMKLYS